ncbi:MAG: ComEA family DNA-binding protein [Pseudonocardiaceae bacterium]|nr:ComEA family DNA-binding protein [Pseudonocardiaceae bacterium]
MPDEPVIAADGAGGSDGTATPAHQPVEGVARQRLGPLVHRWVPASLSEARWDPGRPGALLLSMVTALAAVLAAIGVWADRPVPEPAPTLPMLPAVATAGPSAGPAAPSGELVVSVVGKVAEPGLVTVTDGDRVADAIDAAGGPLPDTDLTALNLARRLADGEQLLVGIEPPPEQPDSGGTAGTSAPGAPATQVNLNTATLDELDTLPGVGPVTAQNIVDWRTTNGPFTSVDQLLEVTGIGDAKLAQLEGLVRV